MLTHFNLVANACQSVMGHPDIQICGENEGEIGFNFSSSYFRNPEWGQTLPKTCSMVFCDSKQKVLAAFEIVWSFPS